VGLTSPHSKNLIVTKVEQRNKLDRFNDDRRKRTRYTEITLATGNIQTVLQPGKINTLRTGSFKLFKRPLPGFFLTILTP